MIKISLNKTLGIATLNEPVADITFTKDGEKIGVEIYPLSSTRNLISSRRLFIKNNLLANEIEKNLLIYPSKIINEWGDEKSSQLGVEVHFQFSLNFYDSTFNITDLVVKNKGSTVFFTSKCISPNFTFFKESEVDFDFSIRKNRDNSVVFQETLKPFEKENLGLKKYVQISKDLNFLPADFYTIDNETFFLDKNNEIKSNHSIFSLTI